MASEAPASDRKVTTADNQEAPEAEVQRAVEAIDPKRKQILLAHEWTKESSVINEETLPQVEACVKTLAGINTKFNASKKEVMDPIYADYVARRDAWNTISTYIKTTLDKLKGRVADYKADLRRQAEAEEREAQRKRDEAAKAAAEAEADAKREQAATGGVSEETAARAEEAKAAARESREGVAAAKQASKEARGGTKEVTVAVIGDKKRGAIVDWMKANAREDLGAFVDEWVRKNAKNHTTPEGACAIPGVTFEKRIVAR